MMSKHKRTVEERIEFADRIIDYFERFGSSGHSFRLGLYMATQWRKYLTEDSPNSNELALFVAALKDGGGKHGSGFYELELEVSWWFEELEENVQHEKSANIETRFVSDHTSNGNE